MACTTFVGRFQNLYRSGLAFSFPPSLLKKGAEMKFTGLPTFLQAVSEKISKVITES